MEKNILLSKGNGLLMQKITTKLQYSRCPLNIITYTPSFHSVCVQLVSVIIGLEHVTGIGVYPSLLAVCFWPPEQRVLTH